MTGDAQDGGMRRAARALFTTDRRDLHNLRSRVYYFRKHHGALAAWCAKLILLLSLSLKWCASTAGRTRRASAGIYAAGLEAVWAA